MLVSTLLHARGFDCITVRDEGMLAADDPAQLAHAISLKRCILTHNRQHFEQLHREHLAIGKPHFGMIVAVRRSPYEIAQRLAILLNSLTADELENQLLYI